MDEIRILLALEPLMLRQLLRLAIAEDPRLRVVGEVAAGDAREIATTVRETHPHVAVLTLAGPDRIPTIGRELLADHPDLTLLLLSDRVAGGLICRGSPPRCRGLTLHSTDHILRAIHDARLPG